MPMGGKRPGAGQPKKQINLLTLAKLCKYQCTKEEAAAFFDVDADTLTARLKDVGTSWDAFFERHRKVGKISLRRAQFLNALGGDRVMQIWLGKQLLDQKDKQEIGFDQDKPMRFRLDMGKRLQKGPPDGEGSDEED